MAANATQTLTHLDLDSAIKSKQLVVGFEPFIALRKLEACGAELHLAWQHPQYGPLAPSLFMPFVIAEGRSRELTSFSLREAARAAADWRRSGLDWKVSVNVPVEDLLDGTLPSAIGVLLDEYNLPAEALTIDIGEADLARYSSQVLPAIIGLRALGCGVALDSAPGDAVIQDLRGMPFTEVKVSGAAIIQFVDRTRHSGTGRVAARVYNARSSGIPVTAVGIDSEAMLWSVQRLDFDAAQGSYICPPTDAFALLRWEKIWRQAAEAIRQRKNPPQRKPIERPAKAAASQVLPPAAPIEEPLPAPPVIESVAVVPDFVEMPAAEIMLPPLIEEEAVHPIEVEAEFEAVAEEEFEPFPDEFEASVEDADALEDETSADALPSVAFAELTADIVEERPGGSAPAEPPAYLHQQQPKRIAEHGTVKADKAAPAQTEPVLELKPRRLPGIDKPIVMAVQNHGIDKFGFLKKLARRG